LTKLKASNERLLNVISAKRVPVAIFTNEVNVDTPQKEAILKQWLDNPLITAGNHSYAHKNFNQTTNAEFESEILKGEKLTKKLLKGTNKQLSYFRFPYNATGKDSASHFAMEKFLNKNGYVSTPFTVESSDWLLNSLYLDALKKNDLEKAKAVGEYYVKYTLEVFEYFEKLSRSEFGRNIKHIYLCHDNELNADYFGQLIDELKERNYSFISLAEAMKDKVYKSEDYYIGPSGMSWFYRWKKDPVVRQELLRNSPDPDEKLLKEYQALK
ncbi:MAG TPA: polysaccharide deacetylase family protein, partial [Cyclobacteriaceae bacterium]